MSGTLFLVGVGPGDPELLTLKAVRILGQVGLIAFPQKPGTPSLSHTIAKPHLNPEAELLPVDIPMCVDPVPAQSAYDALAKRLSTHLNDGHDVAYLCEGDPLFYGSAMYLIDRLADAHNTEIIPGVTSLTASAAALAHPLASRNDVLKVLPAPLDDNRLRAELENAEAVAIIKVGRHFKRIKTLLEESGHAQSAVLVQHATSDKQVITPFADFPQDQVPYFSTILCRKESGARGSEE